MSLLPVYCWVRINEFAPGLLVGPYYWVCSRFIVGSVLLSLLPVYCWVRVAEVAPGLLVGPCCWGCSRFIGGSVLLIFLVFCVVLLCVFTFWVPYYNVRYDFHIKTMFGSSLPPVVCRRVHILFTRFLTYSGVKYILCCVFALFAFVLCGICCQFLWIVHVWLYFGIL